MALPAETFNTREKTSLVIVQKDFPQEYVEQQIEGWQAYSRAVLEGIDAVGLVRDTLGPTLRYRDHIRLPQTLTTERIPYTYTHADGTVEEANFGMTGLKVRLRTGKWDENAYIFVGVRSRGENDLQDLDISRELGVFLVESANGKTTVTYGQTNRQLPVWTDTNPSNISPLFLGHIQRNIQQEVEGIASIYSKKLASCAFPTRRIRTAVPIE